MFSQNHRCSRIHTAVDNISTVPPAVPCHITDAWTGCMQDYSPNPGNVCEPYSVSRLELQERQGKLAHVTSAAKGEMANLFQQIAGSGYAIMLTDADGVLMNFFGDPSFTHAASKTGMMPGGLWAGNRYLCAREAGD